MKPSSEPLWIIDPDDPRAPPDRIWDAMSPAQRKRVVDELPSELPLSEAQLPEGDPHFNAKLGARDVLGDYYDRTGRRVYIACELPVYYPDEKMFAPDVIAVLDVEPHERMSWVVREEGKGVDFALEILVSDRRRGDVESNLARHARLGIAEYFVLDLGRLQLSGYRLSAREPSYQPIPAHSGFYTSQALGLDLRIDETRLRFYHAGVALLDSHERIERLRRRLEAGEARLRAAEERAERAKREREQIERRREEAPQRRMREAAPEHRDQEARGRSLADLERRLAEMQCKLAETERKLAEAKAAAENGSP